MLNDTTGLHDGLNRGIAVICANPVPFALIGIGAAWLVANNTNLLAQITQSARIADDEGTAAARRRDADLVAAVASATGTRAGAPASDVAAMVGAGEAAGAAAERPLGHTGNPLVDEAQDEAGRSGSDGWVHQAAGIAQDALRSARDSGGAILNRAGSYAGDGASRAADQLSVAFERHKLAVGVVGLIAGAALAMLLPATRAEDAVLGETGDGLRRNAREAGQRAVARVREVGARAAARAADAAADTLGGETAPGNMDKPSRA